MERCSMTSTGIARPRVSCLPFRSTDGEGEERLPHSERGPAASDHLHGRTLPVGSRRGPRRALRAAGRPSPAQTSADGRPACEAPLIPSGVDAYVSAPASTRTEAMRNGVSKYGSFEATRSSGVYPVVVDPLHALRMGRDQAPHRVERDLRYRVGTRVEKRIRDAALGVAQGGDRDAAVRQGGLRFPEHVVDPVVGIGARRRTGAASTTRNPVSSRGKSGMTLMSRQHGAGDRVRSVRRAAQHPVSSGTHSGVALQPVRSDLPHPTNHVLRAVEATPSRDRALRLAAPCARARRACAARRPRGKAGPPCARGLLPLGLGR